MIVKICSTCGYWSYPYEISTGSSAIEILLYLFFLIPGIIYSLWRASSKYEICPKCEKQSMIPVESPTGKKLLNEFYKKCPDCKKWNYKDAVKCRKCKTIMEA